MNKRQLKLWEKVRENCGIVPDDVAWGILEFATDPIDQKVLMAHAIATFASELASQLQCQELKQKAARSRRKSV